uniref:Uncharacterized protein n=1 Tax=Arundo donax TaxID=35708 RepID=A0A0A9AJU5_ARUDO
MLKKNGKPSSVVDPRLNGCLSIDRVQATNSECVFTG